MKSDVQQIFWEPTCWSSWWSSVGYIISLRNVNLNVWGTGRWSNDALIHPVQSLTGIMTASYLLHSLHTPSHSGISHNRTWFILDRICKNFRTWTTPIELVQSPDTSVPEWHQEGIYLKEEACKFSKGGVFGQACDWPEDEKLKVLII